MRIVDVIDRKGQRVVGIWANRLLKDALALLDAENIASLVVTEPNGRPVGILTERDIIHALARRGPEVLSDPVGLSMRSPPPVCSIDDTVSAVMRAMSDRRYRHAVVMQGGRMAGVVSIGDLVKIKLEDAEIEGRVLRERALGHMAFE